MPTPSTTNHRWPIAAAMLQFPAVRPDGSRAQDAPAAEWADDLTEIKRAGFDLVEVNDQWVRIGDLSPARIDELAGAARAADVTPSSLAIVRSSIIDPVDGLDNLAYTHRSLDAAAAMGAGIVSIGFHRPLLPAQREALWFWTEPGAVDDPDDQDLWDTAVARVQELGRHAAEIGLDLTLEMYEDGFLGTGPLAARFVQDVALRNTGLNPDVGNLVRLHRPIDDWVETHELTLPFANYWHVKNYFRDEDRARGTITALPAPLELGLIDYRTEIRRALSFGFQGMFVTEHYGGDGLGVSARNRDYVHGILDGRDVPIPAVPVPDRARTAAALDEEVSA
jgi:sugar phosphate isomerase/epimerase